MIVQPNLLVECTRFLAVASSSFISYTLQYTLPNIFAQADHQLLERISVETSEKQSNLFLNYAPDILAHIFLLPTPSQTAKSLALVLQVLQHQAEEHANSIDINSVVKACITKLLCELVFVLGDEARSTMVLQSFTSHPRPHFCIGSGGAEKSRAYC